MPKAKKPQQKDPPFTVGPALLCEEAREERGGGLAILGAQIAAIGVPSFPAEPRLRIVAPLEWNEEATGKVPVVVVVEAEGKKLFRGKIIMEAPGRLALGPLVTPRMRLTIPEETEITVKIGPEGLPKDIVVHMPVVQIRPRQRQEVSLADPVSNEQQTTSQGEAEETTATTKGSAKRRRKLN